MVFQCPTCFTELDIKLVGDIESSSRLNGFLNCPQCVVNTPVVNGITYFTESEISYQIDETSLFNSLKKRVDGKVSEYKKFIKKKISRKLIDPYSAFQPFNESSRSFYPFINALRSIMQPGDKILDTWCRNGWTAFFLSSIFPQQEVISIWEGDKDVLGYSGFDFWFGKRKPDNLQIVFHDENNPLPFKPETFKAVYALDTIHRYNQAILIPELLRVTTQDGLIICPHNHLTNAEPSPFFERGEKQLHGRDYERYFKQILSKHNKSAYIISEPDLFDLKSSRKIYSEPDTIDYNALIAILPSESSLILEPYSFLSEDFNQLRIIVNPYFTFNYSSSKALLDPKHLQGIVGEMLSRHPIYNKRCSFENDLTSTEIKLIYLAKHNYSCLEIVESLGISKQMLSTILLSMSERELIHVLPLAKRAIDLQLYHSATPFASSIENQTLRCLQRKNNDKNNAVIIDIISESKLYEDDVNYLIMKLKYALVEAGLNNDSKLIISSYPQFEILITFWAAMDLGVQAIIISTELPQKLKLNIVNDISGDFLLFTDINIYKQLHNHVPTDKMVIYDDDEVGDHPQSFSNWLENRPQEDEEIRTFDLCPESNAVTLFSSGTTGQPKGIHLSHGALFRSGELMSRIFEWSSDDKIIMVSEIDAMSGLRNICVAARFTETPIVVPSVRSNRSLSIIESIEISKATILACTPALIKQFILLGTRIHHSIKSLRQVMCTAGNLPMALVKEFESLFKIRIVNYYGLTETTGLCIAETNPELPYKGSIGSSVDSIIQIVDENDIILPAGEVGKLRVFNNRLSNGYLNKKDSSNLIRKDGWLYTGDIAYLGENDMFYLKGRERDIIKDAMGNTIYLEEIENLMIEHPEVKDLILFRENNEDGEFIVLVVVPQHLDANKKDLKIEIRNSIRENLGESKIPSKIVMVTELGRNGRGNVSRELLLNF